MPCPDPTPRARLITSYRNGDVRIFTVSRSQTGSFELHEEAKQPEGLERPLPRGMFVLNSKNGTSCYASTSLFANASKEPVTTAKGHSGRDETHHYWIIAGAKGVKCVANLAGGKVSKVEWGKNQTAECVEVITRSGMSLAILVSANVNAIFY